jgi:hypothetical protein
MLSALCNGALALVLCLAIWLIGEFGTSPAEQKKMEQDEIRRGLKDGSIKANMERR